MDMWSFFNFRRFRFAVLSSLTNPCIAKPFHTHPSLRQVTESRNEYFTLPVGSCNFGRGKAGAPRLDGNSVMDTEVYVVELMASETEAGRVGVEVGEDLEMHLWWEDRDAGRA